MEPKDTGSAALVAASDAAQAGVGGAVSGPSRNANPELSPLAAEVQAWRARQRPGPSDCWQVSRRKCVAWAALLPVLLMGLNAAVFLFGLVDVDPEQRFAVVAAATAFWLGLSTVIAREFALLAIFGGGLSATPDGLRFLFGRRSMLLPWSDIESVGVEERTGTQGGSYTVLAIRFSKGGYGWPWAFSLWSSDLRRLCISPYILADPAQVVADGLAAALDQHSDPASRGSRNESKRAPRATPAEPGEYTCVSCGKDLGPGQAVVYRGRPCPNCGSPWEATATRHSPHPRLRPPPV
jgi:hypothetical protein